ncbi:MAG TPA: TetR/AcrR family transcriptional regulator [Burkholderiaceae bacterium]|nr:TetR/AcrR family transcriptional regulator [Burkholderiaceae bacterium]
MKSVTEPRIEPRKAPRQARSQATVDAILDATARILVERGHAATNTNLVAERAGVSVGSLYQYFPNKLALITALHARHAREMTIALEREFKPRAGENLHAALSRVIEAVMHAHQVDADLHRALEQCEDLGLVDDAHDEAHAKMQKVVCELLTAHRAEITAANLDLAAFAMLHAVHALVHATMRERPAGVSVKGATREIVRLTYAYLTAR